MAARLIICRSRMCVGLPDGRENRKVSRRWKTKILHSTTWSQVLFQNSTLAPRMESQTGVVMILWQNNNLM